jgi:hypothetical protein
MDSVDMKQANAFDGRTKWRLLAAGLPSSLTKFPPEKKTSANENSILNISSNTYHIITDRCLIAF